MDKDFWHERWAKNETGFHLKDANPFLKKHWSSINASPQDTVFVPLCGKSKDLIWLAERVQNVIGVELSQQATEEFFSENKLLPDVSKTESFIKYRYKNITILCGDFFQLNSVDIPNCQLVYDRASFIAFPSAMRQAYIDKLQQILPDETRRLLITIEYPQHEMNGPPFSVPPEEVHQYFSQQHEIQCLASIDMLDKAQRFKDKGVTQMKEHVFLLEKVLLRRFSIF